MRWLGFFALGILGLSLDVGCDSSTERTLDSAPLPGRARPGDDDDDKTQIIQPETDSGATDTDAGTDSGPPPSTVCTIPNLVLCFDFNGDALDRSPNALKPTSSKVTIVTGGIDRQAGQFLADSGMPFAPNAVFDLPADAATIEAWVKRTINAANAVVFDDDGRFSLTITPEGKVLCQSSGGAVTGVTDVTVDQWVHIACVIDKGELRAYVNGAEDVKGVGSVAPNPTLGAAVGQNSPDGDPYLGLMDSFRVLKVARTAAELLADAKKP